MAELATNKYLDIKGLGKFWTLAKEFIAKNYVDKTSYNAKMEALDAKDVELDNAIKVEAERAAGVEAGLQEAVDSKVAQTAYDAKMIELGEAIDSKVAQTAYDAKMIELDAAIAERVTKTDYNVDQAKVNSDIEALKAAVGDGSGEGGEGLIDLVSKNTASINALVGDDVKEDGAPKSVRTIANEELASQLLSGKADADFKTLQDLAAWLEDHPESVAAMNGEISGLKGRMDTAEGEIDALQAKDTELAGQIATKVEQTVFDALQTTVSGLETSKADKTVVEELSGKVADLEGDTTNADNIAKIAGEVGLVDLEYTGVYVESNSVRSDIAAAKTAIEAEVTRATGVEAGLQEAVDSKVAQTAYDAKMIELDAAIAGKVAQGDFNALEETVNGISDAVNSLDATYVTHDEFNSAVISDAEIGALFVEE
jgi:hypothetical protein